LTGFWRAGRPLDEHAAADEAGQRKIRPLQLAKRVWLSVPDTVITNDPSKAREFVAKHIDSGLIRKAFRSIAEAPRSTTISPDR
jgi:hypothetical protein